MPRKKVKSDEPERPYYLSEDGKLDFDKIFKHQPKQVELLHTVTRNGFPYVSPLAPQCLSVGGIRSGKTTGWLMYFVQHYCMKYEGCDILVLRRTFKELESGAIADFKTFMPKELYTYDQTKHVATLINGSRVVFGHCVAKGTLVTTQRGLVPIEEVTTEDLALTRRGYRRILWSGKTGEKSVRRLGTVFSTEDHKFHVNGHWKTAKEIRCQRDSEKTVPLFIHKQSYSKALSIIATQTQSEDQTEYILKAGETALKPTYTSQCGNLNTEQFPQVKKFTTKTGTLSTTALETLSLSPCMSTGSSTPLGELVGQGDHSYESHGKLSAETVVELFSPEQERNSFATLSVEITSEDSELLVPVYDLQVEDEHEFFANGVLVHNCQNNKERDIEQYLGQAYPGIVVDECGQFSPDAWQMLYSRNTVNASCKPDENGNLPVPAIVGCTNPLGPFYEYYRTVFVEKEPWNKPEDAKKDVEGAWWIPEAGTWRLIYEPKEYAHQRSTVLDNPQLLKRDPGIIARLNSLPKAKRDKMLLGLDGKFEGQYFDVWDPEYHVINLREDPKAIIWQDYQPIWMGIDWGVQHITACYFFTRALVKNTIGDDYKSKVVCFQEIVSSGGKTNKELAAIIDSRAKLPNRDGKVKINHIFFSHEKFSRQVSAHTPADEFSRELRPFGLPPVSRATTDRIGSASLMYNMMKNGDLAITDNCKDIILSIPSLMRDPDLLDDVLKVDAKGDDCYDGFRYGLFGMMSARKRPDTDIINEHAKQLDPLAAHFYRMKMLANRVSANTPFVQAKQPQWQTKMNS